MGQVGILVADIVTASDQYQRIFGVTEWRRYTYGPGLVPDLWYRGRAASDDGRDRRDGLCVLLVL